jgi:altronate dehydratase
VVCEDVTSGQAVDYIDGCVTAQESIPKGHKMAIAVIASGSSVLKYGEPIGVALSRIEPGQHVHVQNLRSARAGAGGPGE